MCQLFAFSARQPQNLNPVLGEFFAHADENPHGWGYADLVGREPRILRSAQRADTGPCAASFLTHPHQTNEALAHIRYATIGQVELANCHPFTATDASGRHWTLAHKGTIFDYSPLNPYFEVQMGTTDSERILLYLVDWINAATQSRGAPLAVDERFAVFSYLVEVLSPGNCVNLLIHDGEHVFIYSNYVGGLNVLTGQNCVLLCTSKLAAAHELVPQQTWQPLSLCTPLCYRLGELLLSGEATGEQYFDRDEDTRYLYQDYAAL
jgi:glutamine amidotransferase